MKKPATMKFVSFITIVRLCSCIFLYLMILLISVFKSSSGIWGEFKQGFLEVFGISNGVLTAYQSGYLAGMFALPLILAVLGLVFISKRKYKALIVIFVLQIILSISNWINFIFSVALLLIVLLDKNAKNYLNGIEEEKIVL